MRYSIYLVGEHSTTTCISQCVTEIWWSHDIIAGLSTVQPHVNEIYTEISRHNRLHVSLV